MSKCWVKEFVMKIIEKFVVKVLSYSSQRKVFEPLFLPSYLCRTSRPKSSVFFSFILRPKIFSRKWSSKIKRIYNFIFEYIYLNFCPLWLWLMNLRWWPKLYNDMTILIRIIQFRKIVRSTNIEQFPKSCYFFTYLYQSKITGK